MKKGLIILFLLQVIILISAGIYLYDKVSLTVLIFSVIFSMMYLSVLYLSLILVISFSEVESEKYERLNEIVKGLSNISNRI